MDTVYQLRDAVAALKHEQEVMRAQLDEGRRAHLKLEAVMRRTLKNSGQDLETDSDAHTV